jgi:predicted CxxxxCH...CXXCH cytochrome family protein
MTSPTEGVYDLRGRSGGQLACARCHSMHLQTPNAKLTRMANDQDQMCMDCHRSRAVTTSASGTHPVNINYAAKAGASQGKLLNSMVNANSSNGTSNLQSYIAPTTGNLVCSTCHGVHYTDSRSSTFDGASSAKGRKNFANLSAGDGYILRTDRRGKAVLSGQTMSNQDSINICTNCHAGKRSHNAKDQDVQCSDCHGAHVEFDATSSSALNPQHLRNAYLVRRNVTKAGMANKIYFRYTALSKREYKNTQGTGVCQGCHDVPPPSDVYPPEHDSTSAVACNKCHYHSSQAGSFSGACGKCHGNPPTSATPGPGGLATPATGALGGGVAAGAHEKHVVTRKMDCNVCHNGYAGRTMPNNSIDMGFQITGGTFPGFKGNSLAGTYNNTVTLNAPYTGFSNGGSGINNTCANVYCHGATLPPGSVSSAPGAMSSPSWSGNSTQVSCGTCHTTDGSVLYGSHPAHAAGGGSMNLECDTCHPAMPVNDTTHMNGAVQWDFSVKPGGLGISPTAQYKAPDGVYSNTGETGRLAPSSANVGYGTCNNIVCHGQATNIPWGGTLRSTDTCAKCHSSFQSYSTVTNKEFYSTGYPVKVTSNTNAKVGAHITHLSGRISARLHCEDCHGSVALKSATHMNGVTDFNWSTLATKNGTITYDSATGQCSNVYCHGASFIGGTDKAPIWTTPFMSAQITAATCKACHGFPPSGHASFGVSTPSGFPTSVCSGCHPNVNSLGTTYDTIFVDKSKHIDGTIDKSGSGGCDGCHGYPPSTRPFKGTQNNWSSARFTKNSTAGGSHTVAAHVPKTAMPSQGWNNCTNCHTEVPDHTNYNPARVRFNPRNRFNSSVLPKYTSNRLLYSQHVTGTCSNVACHYQKSPKW